jgi:hypothetical protein
MSAQRQLAPRVSKPRKSGMPRKAPLQFPRRACAWVAFIFDTHCNSCGLKINRFDRAFWRVGFCRGCRVRIPRAVDLHLERALHSRWFMLWARTAQRLLREAERQRRFE